jgi:hypothetical protein|tara:strand:- start:1683 stop:2132 length:450 start_codon:yes stop_codon:yes gene_type:complete
MANIPLQRGQQQAIEVTYKLANGNIPNFNSVDNNNNNAGTFDAELVIRKKRGDNFQGQIIDILRHGVTSGTAVSEADSRIDFIGTGGSASQSVSGHNIVLNWTTAQATLLPNEAVTVYGDLKITNTVPNPDEVVHHIRLIFDIQPEITA